MRRISACDIDLLRKPVQYFPDCYLVSSIGALARSENGQKFLSKNICIKGDDFRITYRDVFNKREDYFVTENEINRLIPVDKYCNEIIIKARQNPILKAIEVSMNKLLSKHPDKKPFVSRLVSCNEKFEYNKPSNFLEMFTGKKPIILNEGGLRMSLKKQESETVELLNKIKDEKEFSFVAGTGFNSYNLKAKFPSVHCYVLENVEEGALKIFDCRRQKSITLTFSEFIKQFKFLVGYFNNMLK